MLDMYKNKLLYYLIVLDILTAKAIYKYTKYTSFKLILDLNYTYIACLILYNTSLQTDPPPVTDNNGTTIINITENPLAAHRLALTIIGVVGVSLSTAGIILFLIAYAILE